MRDVLLPWTEENMAATWIYHQDNNPKYTARLTNNYLSETQPNHISIPLSIYGMMSKKL